MEHVRHQANFLVDPAAVIGPEFLVAAIDLAAVTDRFLTDPAVVIAPLSSPVTDLVMAIDLDGLVMAIDLDGLEMVTDLDGPVSFPKTDQG